MRVGLYQAHFPQLDADRNYALPPLGLGYLAAYARKQLSGVEVFIEHDLDALIAAKPDLVGITFVTANAWIAARQAAQVKEALGCPVIAGGPHISTLPTVLYPAFDLAVLGEGELTFVELLQLFQAEKRFDPASLAKIPGLLYRDPSGALLRSAPRPKIADLDSIPYPDRGEMQGKWTHAVDEVQMMTSRGCPYNCSFCSTVKLWGQMYYHPSDAYVLGEVEQIRRTFNPKIIHFYDDLFIVRKDRTLRILSGLRERGLHNGVQFTCFVRANLLDDELMDAFARTNFKMLNIGFESGSDEVLKKLNKRGTSAERNARAIELGRKHGLQYSSCLILGVPGETRHDILATFDFVRASMDTFGYVEFSMLHVLPGTSVWDEAKARLGVSESNMAGIVLEPEDLVDEERFYRERWPYLNEDKLPREELLNYFFIGQNISRMVWEYARLRQQMNVLHSNAHSPQYVAANISFADMLKAKVRRRLQHFMPIGEPPKL